MKVTYQGVTVDIRATEVTGGVLIQHGEERHIVARRGFWQGRAYTDTHSVWQEIKTLIDAGIFISIRQIPEYVPTGGTYNDNN